MDQTALGNGSVELFGRRYSVAIGSLTEGTSRHSQEIPALSELSTSQTDGDP